GLGMKLLGLGLVSVRGGCVRPLGKAVAAAARSGCFAVFAAMTFLTSFARAGRAQNTTHLLIVSGLGGEPAYTQAFLGYGKLLKQAAIDRYGVRPENVTFLAEKADADPLVDGRSGKEEIEGAVAKIAARSSQGDPVMIVLIG